MLVLSDANTYSFPNMVVKVTDNTVASDDTVTPTPDVPKFNVMIPTVQDVGPTNVMELYYPGEPNRYINMHGSPNPLKYGFGPDFIHGILSRSASGVGVYTMNLRGPSATNANVIVSMKYKVASAVPYTNEEGTPYYIDANGTLSTTAGEGKTAVVRDVLTVKFVTDHVDDCKSWVDVNTALNNKYTTVADENGYKTIPWFGIMYRGASAYGNSIYMSMKPVKAEFDGKTYYQITMFDGANSVVTNSDFSMDVNAGVKYNTTYYIENRFNETFPTMRFIGADNADDIAELFNQYLYTIEDYADGTQASSTLEFSDVDPFSVNTFAINVDANSLDITANKAITLSGGFDGTETSDQLFKLFYDCAIISDLSSVLRYRISYIPDIGYNDETITSIKALVKKRNRMTNTTIMVGGLDTFQSALVEHQAKHFDTMPNLRQIARVQSPMKFNEFIRRTLRYPAMYFDTMALMDHFGRNGNYYQPFAGYDARWSGYIEDTMVYPAETPDYINSLTSNRINFVMKDAAEGAYLADQQMNTLLASDQTELNNAFLISNMLYDLVNLVHRNHFKFNEAEEVRLFKETVNDVINSDYAIYSASLSVDVFRLGTIGRAKSANKITVTINMKDVNKYTDVDIILTDE